MQKENIITVENVSRYFYKSSETVTALNNVSLMIGEKEFIAIRGPSGSGKTTLINIIGGLDKPDTGNVYHKGKKLTNMSDNELTELRRKEFGFVFQSYALIDILTAYENVELPLKMLKIKPKERYKRVRECLELVGLWERSIHRTFELSGGEQQRVGIARALVHYPSLILADEPTGAVNQEVANDILKLFEKIVTGQGKTVVVVTHDPLVTEYVDITFELIDGEIQ